MTTSVSVAARCLTLRRLPADRVNSRHLPLTGSLSPSQPTNHRPMTYETTTDDRDDIQIAPLHLGANRYTTTATAHIQAAIDIALQQGGRIPVDLAPAVQPNGNMADVTFDVFVPDLAHFETALQEDCEAQAITAHAKHHAADGFIDHRREQAPPPETRSSVPADRCDGPASTDIAGLSPVTVRLVIDAERPGDR